MTFIIVTLIAAILGLALTLYVLIVLTPGEEIRQENIQKILAIESPVYYRDGVSKIGVFFQEQHRQYVPFEEIPKDFVDAIVAAEDHEFFSHFGVDFSGILRAMVANLRAGRVVQGGSTITQQTAKNLFKRQSRSLAAKLKELLFALRLEYHYPKERILEFYANQFYVSGNGRGLGVAARYYFDKDVSELNLVECAFIAGSVKRPGAYNPFTKESEEAARQARELARHRTRYVIKQMRQLGMIDEHVFAEAVQQTVPFRQGKMSYSLNAIMDQVKIALGEPLVEEALSRHGIDNMATSGARVFTTIDRVLQEKSHLALRKELSRLDIRLSGYDRKAVQNRYRQLIRVTDRPKVGGFAIARVKEISKKDGASEVRISFGGGQDEEAVEGIIDNRGLLNALQPLVRFLRFRWSEAKQADLPLLLKQIKPGDMVYVSVREKDNISGKFILDLEKYPTLQGGVLLLEDGVIRAMVGGMENRNYNRSISAKRPLGSVFKPLVFMAAQQLGWSSIDLLRNSRDVFVYFDQPYFPRPDHVSPHQYVSMSWAGVMSENVASVWLLYHLCDKLNLAQFKEIADFLGTGRQLGESYSQYVRRVRDEYGIVVNRERLYEAAFEEAASVMETDLVFEGRIEEYELLRDLYYSLDRIMVEDDPEEPEETLFRQNLLKKSFTHLQRIKNLLQSGRTVQTDGESGEEKPLYLARKIVDGEQTDAFAVFSEEPDRGKWQLADWSLLFGPRPFWSFWVNTVSLQDVRVEGMLSVSLLDSLEPLIEREFERLKKLPTYGPEVLFRIRDFRIFTGLRYLIGLCRSLGIMSDLDPVLSFPLGSNVISLFEAAKAFEGIMRGEVVLSQALEAGAELYLIDRIESSDGEVIFEPERLVRGVSDESISLSVRDILRNVVRFGTGRMADRLRLHSQDPEREKYLSELNLRVPAFGKTGTANDFTNAAFVGFVPGPQEKGNELSFERGYVLSCYVGYDDNTAMVRGTTHITGAVGALPIWTKVAQDLIQETDFAANMDVVDLSFTGFSELPVLLPDLGQKLIAVDADGGGLPLAGAEPLPVGRSMEKRGPSILFFGEKNSRNEAEPKRMFTPYWQSRLD